MQSHQHGSNQHQVLERSLQQSNNKQRRPQALSNMAVVQFRRGAQLLFYRQVHGSNSPFLIADFLKKKSDIGVLPEDRSTPRGIPALKKDGIVKNLCPLMPRSRALFWEQLPKNNEAVDLINTFLVMSVCFTKSFRLYEDFLWNILFHLDQLKYLIWFFFLFDRL